MVQQKFLLKPFLFGLAAAASLLVFYAAVVAFISGFDFVVSQFEQFWFFIIVLALGFGIQVGIYFRIKQILKSRADKISKGVVAATGTTSGVAMISCCSHYFTNLLPIISATGIAVFTAQYQLELFWLGTAFNFLGIAFMANKMIQMKRTFNSDANK